MATQRVPSPVEGGLCQCHTPFPMCEARQIEDLVDEGVGFTRIGRARITRLQSSSLSERLIVERVDPPT